MPYVDPETRHNLRYGMLPETSGELNYAITEVIIRYVLTNGLSYRTISDVKGALIGAKDEFGRRIADPYEDLKIAANGDVYDQVLELFPKPTRSNDE